MRDAAQLAWVVNLGCIDLNPHPVRADDLDHPDELRVDLDPVPGIGWTQIVDVALVTQARCSTDFGLTGWPKTSGSRGFHIYCRIEPRWTFAEVRRAAVALAREVERRAPEIATSKWWKEERHGVFIDYNQNAKDRTVASAYSVRPTPDARVSTPLRGTRCARCDPATFTIDTVPERFARTGTRWAGSTRPSARSSRCSSSVEGARERWVRRRAVAAAIREEPKASRPACSRRSGRGARSRRARCRRRRPGSRPAPRGGGARRCR